MKVLIDTNIYSLAMRGDNDIVYKLKTIDKIGISAISIGELHSGFKGGQREIENRNELNIFLDSPRVVLFSIDAETADFYASILNNLRKNGTPIPTNDIWIAAQTMEHGAELITSDRHFENIAGLVYTLVL